MVVLLALQTFVVLFVALHNWIPLGALNNVKGVRVALPTGKLLLTTMINLAPVAVGLASTAFYFGRHHPGWVFWWLWIYYGLACYGSLKAWWIPYLVRPDPALILAIEPCTQAHTPFSQSTMASAQTRCICFST